MNDQTKETAMTATAQDTTSIVVPRCEVARALRAAASVKSKALHIDLDGDAPRLTGYTPDVAVSVTLDAEITEPLGVVSVPRALLAGVLAYCGHEVMLSIADGRQLTVTSDDTQFEIRAVPPATPPTDPTYRHDLTAEGTNAVMFEAPVLVETLRRTVPFASRDMTRPILATVALFPSANCAVATDSYRLAVVRYGDDGPDGESILLPVEGAVSLQRTLSKKLGPVEITSTDSHHLVQFEDTRWSLRRPPVSKYDHERGRGGYPNWRNLLPDTAADCTLKIDRDDLLTASRAAAVVAVRNAPLRLRVGGDGARITAYASDTAAMTRALPSADVTGADMEIGLNPQFVGDVCATAPVERLTVKLIAPLRPIVVEAARDIYLLMPIRLNV